ncbi:BA75_02818T0 [Komagataella pastoris]|uniref:Actin cytoskeleton-regulatory complex protein SLA1 n=1 Tax=Komagataella pastoris TaxID=4922 RepID=A0A1B2JC65_PICPA|nr:BA75_02818T0 [Komagataella pastoris]
MTSVFLGVYRALFDYQAQNDEELTVHENDLLYVLEKSEIDDWWKVKQRVIGVNVEEPIGLVPSTYIEPATPIGSAVALYDYDRQTEEEITFKENDTFDVYDTDDQEWILVGLNNIHFGFVPANYIQVSLGTAAPASSNPPVLSPASFPPPPQRINNSSVPSLTKDAEPTRNLDDNNAHEEDEDVPPPMPTRPTGTTATSNIYAPQDSESEEEPSTSSRKPSGRSKSNDDFVKGDYFTWDVQEINGRKKRKAVLGIGNGSIYVQAEGHSSKKWDIRNLINFSNEKKHVFFDFTDPSASYELHAGSKDAADAILSIVGDLKGASSMRALKEVKAASSAPKTKTGKVSYNFDAESPDELSIREGDVVYILNDKESSEWWIVQDVNTNKKGVVPASYIELISGGGSTLASIGSSISKGSKKAFGSSRKRKEKERKQLEEQRAAKRETERERQRLRSKEERDRLRKLDERERRKKQKATPQDEDKPETSKPNPHRVRTWIDSSGSFKVEAEYLGVVDGKIHLHKTNGVKIAVAAPKLSLEDLEYVERITGMSLEKYKPKPKSSGSYSRPSKKPPSRESSPKEPSRSGVKPSVPKIDPPRDPDYDWFQFFLSCDIDPNNCQRYSLVFINEQLDESSLQDLTPSLLRSLGLREGDILRVQKFLDNKFGRSKTQESTANGGLFTTSDGTLKNNRSTDVLPSTVVTRETLSPAKTEAKSKRIDDEAWALKPAAESSSQMDQFSRPVSAMSKQLTGSIQDLVNLKPLGDNANNAPVAHKAETQSTTQDKPSAPVLEPVKTGAARGPVQAQPTSGGFVTAQPTGALVAMPTGFMPITMVPVKTGGTIALQPTGGFVSLQRTGGVLPQVTGGLIPVQTGGLVMPQTSFGVNPTLQPTGGLLPVQRTGGLVPVQRTGGLIPVQQTGRLVPVQQTGGLIPVQRTGGLVPVQRTGNLQPVPTTSFGGQPTGTFVPQSSFGNQLSSNLNNPQTTFGSQPTGGFPQTSFAQNQFGQSTGGFPQYSFGQQQTVGLPQNTFGQQTGGIAQNSFGQQAGGIAQSSFGQQTGGYQTGFQGNGSIPMPQSSFGTSNLGFNGATQQNYNAGMGQSLPAASMPPLQPSYTSSLNGMSSMLQNISISQQPQQAQPMTTFGAPVAQPPLQAQPTGFGFGNSPYGGQNPLQSQPTGKRANLSAATADNPFGF